MYVSKAYSAYEDGESHRVVDTTVQIDEDLWRNKMQPDINQPIENPKLKDLISDLRKADNAHFAAVNEAIAEEIAMNAFMLARITMTAQRQSKKIQFFPLNFWLTVREEHFCLSLRTGMN